jgi:cell division protein FtsZ
MAISSPLLEASIDGAHGVLLSIQGGSDLGLFEINEAAQLVSNSAAPEANIIFGAVIDDALGDEVRVTVIAAGFDEGGSRRARPPRAAAGFAADPAPAPAAASPAETYQASAVPAPPVPADVWASPVSDTEDGPEPASAPAAADEAAGPEQAAEETGFDSVPSPRPAHSEPATPRPRPDAAAAARVFDAATTRRRSVVFEEDDELDVPDFLK